MRLNMRRNWEKPTEVIPPAVLKITLLTNDKELKKRFDRTHCYEEKKGDSISSQMTNGSFKTGAYSSGSKPGGSAGGSVGSV